MVAAAAVVPPAAVVAAAGGAPVTAEAAVGKPLTNAFKDKLFCPFKFVILKIIPLFGAEIYKKYI